MALATLAWATSAEAQSCGQVVTENTTLTADLNCLGDGLVIGADGIVLDLNGHTVDGAGLGVGIRNDGFDGVTIKNGTVKEFDYGIQLNAGTEGNLVQGLTLTLNQDVGIQLSGAHNNRVLANTISQQPEQGVVLLGSTGNVVANNRIDGTQGMSLVLADSRSNTIQDNLVSNGSDNGVVFTASSENTFLRNTLSAIGDMGLLLEAGSNSNTVMRNTFTRTGGSGVSVSDSGVSVVDSNNNWFELNTLEQPGDAAFKLTRAHENQILRNTVRGASDCAIFLEFSNSNTVQGNDLAANAAEQANTCGIDLAHSDRNLVQSNNASNTTSIGINLEDASDNQIVANIVSRNKAQGIYVVAEAEAGAANPNLIDRNIANSNLGDGILVASGGHTIRNNTASSNDGWGIHAAPGNTDGGGNVASGNAEITQCFGIICHEAPVACGGTAVISADADSWVAEGNVNSNFGTDSILKVRSKSPANNFGALVRFRLPPMPEGCQVAEARLQLYAASATTGRTIQALRIVDDWTESGVTWANQPGTTGVAAIAGSGLGTIEWVVTTQVQAMYSDSNNGFLIRDAVDGDVASPEQSFHGREKTPDHPPALVITFQ
jgi:parallel beta-helix repeat protein